MSDLVEVDARRRVTLGKLARHSRYLVTVEPDGTLILTPAVVMSELEARFLANPELAERVERNRQDPDRMVKRTPKAKPKPARG